MIAKECYVVHCVAGALRPAKGDTVGVNSTIFHRRHILGYQTGATVGIDGRKIDDGLGQYVKRVRKACQRVVTSDYSDSKAITIILWRA